MTYELLVSPAKNASQLQISMAAEHLGRVPDTHTTTDESSAQRFFFVDDRLRPSGITNNASRIGEGVRLVLNLTPEERAEFRRTALEGVRFSLAPPSVPVMAEPPAEPAVGSPAPLVMQNVMLESDFKYT